MPYKDVLAAYPATVGSQGPCSHAADHPLCFCSSQHNQDLTVLKWLTNHREQLAEDGDIPGRILDHTQHTSTHHTSAIVVQLAAGQKQPRARDLQDIHIVLGAG